VEENEDRIQLILMGDEEENRDRERYKEEKSFRLWLDVQENEREANRKTDPKDDQTSD